jgi:hypothetical protein
VENRRARSRRTPVPAKATMSLCSSLTDIAVAYAELLVDTQTTKNKRVDCKFGE